jgi:hypothetical protein
MTAPSRSSQVAVSDMDGDGYRPGNKTSVSTITTKVVVYSDKCILHKIFDVMYYLGTGKDAMQGRDKNPAQLFYRRLMTGILRIQRSQP